MATSVMLSAVRRVSSLGGKLAPVSGSRSNTTSDCGGFSSNMKIKLSFVQRMELHDTGVTKVYIPPHRLPDDEVTWGEWVTVTRVGRQIIPVTDLIELGA